MVDKEQVIKYNEEEYLAYISYFKLTNDYHVTFSLYDKCNDLLLHIEDTRCKREPDIKDFAIKTLNFLEYGLENKNEQV